MQATDLTESSGAFAERLLAMLGAGDVVVASGPVRREALTGGDDRLVTVSISPFGDDGPYAHWRASDLVAQAMGGMLAASGRPDGPPLAAPGCQAHQQAGIFAAIGALAALLVRENTGRGQHVEVSVQAAVAASLEHVLARFLHEGVVTRRSGRLHWTRHFRVGPGRDGWGVRTTLGDWTTLIEWMKADGAAGDLGGPEYADPSVRQARAEHVFDVIDAWADRQDGEALASAAQLRGLAFAAVRQPEALSSDPQLLARGFFAPGHRPLPGPPFRLETFPGTAPAAATADPTATRPLAGVRVLDFTWLVAGPTATRVLADLGADVVKIEHPRTADAGDRRGGVTGALNRGKRSVVLDLTTDEGRTLARHLAATADVVIDNFSARVMEQWGLDPASLRLLRPDVVCVRMTGFGLTGPDRDLVSFGPTLEARAGFTALMADTDGTPLGFGYSYADVASGHLAALAVLAALWRRRRTGAGALVDFSQFEAVASLLAPVLAARADPAASLGLGAAPEGVYACAGDDRWLAISVTSDDDWRRFARALGDPPWTRDERFATLPDRARNREALDMRIEAWTRTLDAEAAMNLLQRAGIAAGRVADARDLCRRDPQLAARGFFVDVATPEGHTVRMDGPPFRLSETPAAVTTAGPLLGEHTGAVLRGATPELARPGGGA